MSLCANSIKTHVNKYAISTDTALKLGIQALRSYLKMTCEYELYTLSNERVGATKGYGKNHMKVRPPLVIVYHLWRNRFF